MVTRLPMWHQHGVNAWHRSQPCGTFCHMETNGLLIRSRRIALGHGMNRFAAIAGISGPALSRIENGKRRPRPETLKKIADALGCHLTEVLHSENSEAAAAVTATASSEPTNQTP